MSAVSAYCAWLSRWSNCVNASAQEKETHRVAIDKQTQHLE